MARARVSLFRCNRMVDIGIDRRVQGGWGESGTRRDWEDALNIPNIQYIAGASDAGDAGRRGIGNVIC